jgi:selenocysteine-specific elongation factor
MQLEAMRERLFANAAVGVFRTVIDGMTAGGTLFVEKDIVRLASHKAEATGNEGILLERLGEIFATRALEPPRLEEALAGGSEGLGLTSDRVQKVFRMLLARGEIVKVSDEFYFSAAAISDIVDKLREYAADNSDRLIDMAAFKELAGISRKYAIPLLEYLDREKITLRVGDKRTIR